MTSEQESASHSVMSDSLLSEPPRKPKREINREKKKINHNVGAL